MTSELLVADVDPIAIVVLDGDVVVGTGEVRAKRVRVDAPFSEPKDAWERSHPVEAVPASGELGQRQAGRVAVVGVPVELEGTRKHDWIRPCPTGAE